MTCYRWIGYVASVVLALFCGIAASFSVYAVKMKRSFDLNQSQVEWIAAFVEMGWSFQIFSAWVIKRFGYQACYVVVLFLAASSNLLMWVATRYEAFFSENVWLLCLNQFLNTAGTTGAFQCVSGIATEHFSNKHTGKVIGIYMAAFGFAKFYYSILFEIFFEQQETLGNFFLTVAISIMSLVILCFFVHRQPTREDSDSETANIIPPGDTNKIIQEGKVDETDRRQIKGHMVKKSLLCNLLSSSYFYLMGVSYAFQLTAVRTTVNNITGIGTAVGAKNPFNLVSIVSIVMIISRLTFGILYDYFGTLRAGFVLLFAQCFIFAGSMLVCLFWLNSSTIYFMVVLASIGCGAGYFLFITMLVSEFGIPSYPIISGILEVIYAPVVLISHLGAGWTYDNSAFQSQTTELFCKECFYGTYVIVLSLTTAVLLLQIVNASICYAKLRRKNHG